MQRQPRAKEGNRLGAWLVRAPLRCRLRGVDRLQRILPLAQEQQLPEEEQLRVQELQYIVTAFERRECLLRVATAILVVRREPLQVTVVRQMEGRDTAVRALLQAVQRAAEAIALRRAPVPRPDAQESGAHGRPVLCERVAHVPEQDLCLFHSAKGLRRADERGGISQVQEGPNLQVGLVAAFSG